MNIGSRDLEVFLALVDERSFTRAAARCHLSQSAFSTRIGALEDLLGARLFDRTTRSVELTPAGALFVPAARRLYSEFADVVENFRDHAARRKGRVVVAALPSLCAAWLPGVLAGFRLRHPGIELALADLLSAQCLAQVRGGQADFALASSVGAAEDLDARELFQDRFYVVCREDHPLARLGAVELPQLLSYPFVHLHRQSSVRQTLETCWHPLAPPMMMEVEHLATLAGLVQAGLGVTVVPALTLFQFRRGGLVVRPLADATLARPIYLVWRRGRSLSVAAQALFDDVLEQREAIGVGGATLVA